MFGRRSCVSTTALNRYITDPLSERVKRNCKRTLERFTRMGRRRDRAGVHEMMDIMWPISQSHFHVSCLCSLK